MLASRSGRFPRRPDFSSKFMVMSLLRSSLESNSRSRMAACALISAWVRRGLRSRVSVTTVPPFPPAMSLILPFVLSMSTFPGIPVFSSGFPFSTPPLRISVSPLSLRLPLRIWLASIGLSVIAAGFPARASMTPLGSGGSDTLAKVLAGFFVPSSTSCNSCSASPGLPTCSQ